MALQNYSVKPMSEFLGGNYYIPNYQRDYAWEENELGDFWHDLKYTVETKNDHFFGQIVVHNDDAEGKKYIIDGQQRTITSMIFMRTLQYLFHEIYHVHDDIKKAGSNELFISMAYLGNDDDNSEKHHLHMGAMYDAFFSTKIINGKPSLSKEKKKACERLRKAYLFFFERLNEEITKPEDPADPKSPRIPKEPHKQVEILDEYYNAFKDKFSIMYMEATKLEEAFIIFETLNARGRDLETADLLKNYIFSKSNDVDNAQKYWNSMIGKLDKADPTKYIRYFWNSNHKFTREKELYRRITGEIRTPRESSLFLENLDRYAQTYHDVAYPDDNVDFSDEGLARSLKGLNTLKAKTFYPIILAMKQAQAQYNEADIKSVSQTLESFVFRNYTICGHTANRGEVFLAQIAKDIYDGSLSNVQEIEKAIRAEMVSDKEFSDVFKTWQSKNKDIIRYILRNIHKYLDENHELNLDNTEVHIEHIMPENNSIWKVDESTHSDYLWRLGNLMLLGSKLNTSIKNKEFKIKKKQYKDSKIEPNKDVIAESNWTSKKIDKRQKKLCEYAVEIWK